VLADLGWARKASGTAAAQINVETSGASFADLMRRMTGKATLYVKQGEVTGLNLGEAARLMGSRPLSIPLDWKSGHTIFEQMSGTAAIADGIAELTGGSLTGTNYNASLTGQIGLRDRSLHLKGNVVGAGGMPEKGLPFEVVGGWDDPALNLDVQALIKRSGAVVPLLGITRAVTIDPGQ
jgi:AsmA protein